MTSRPASVMRPVCSGVKPEIRSNIVVLPAPFGPITPTISPAPISNVTLSTARMPPKVTDIPFDAQHRDRARRRARSADVARGWRPAVARRSVRRGRSIVRHLVAGGQEHGPQEVGSVEQFGGRPAEADLAALHEVGPVGHREGDVHALLDEHDGDAVGGHALHDRQQLPDDHRSEAERQLVDQQHLRAHDEAHRQGEHLLLAAGQVGGGGVEPLAEDRERLERLGDGLP